MIADNFILNLKEFKNNLIILHYLTSGMKLQGYLKNIKYVDDNKSDIEINIEEVKDINQVLKKYSCKNKGKKDYEEKKRIKTRICDINESMITDSKKGKDTLYKIEFEEETLGIQVIG